MDDKTKALEDAAFHAWLTLGELLTNKKSVTRAELKAAYGALEEALAAFRAERGGRAP